LDTLAASLGWTQPQFGHKLVKLLDPYVAGSRLPPGEDSRDVDGTLPAARRGDDIADEAHFSTGRGGGCGGQNFVEILYVFYVFWNWADTSIMSLVVLIDF
jgi:hypothetical protein